MRQDIVKIVKLLNRAYGKPKRRKLSRPIDELVRTILSQNTTDKNSLKAFAILKKNFKTWDKLLNTDTRKIAYLIREGGLANIKAKRMKEILSEIKRREGRITLSSLKIADISYAIRYLRSLNGVGPKTAACVLLFSFGKPVMPVDTHIFRVTKRLGLIKDQASIKEAYRIFSGDEIFSRGLIYEFHLGIIEHGRRTCRARNPKCGICVLYKLCRFKLKDFFKNRGSR